jgi:hypothetical protein
MLNCSSPYNHVTFRLMDSSRWQTVWSKESHTLHTGSIRPQFTEIKRIHVEQITIHFLTHSDLKWSWCCLLQSAVLLSFRTSFITLKFSTEWYTVFFEHSTHRLNNPCWVYDYNSTFVKIWVFTVVIMKNAVFWDVTLCGSVRTDVLEERRFLQEPHGITSQKTAFFNSPFDSIMLFLENWVHCRKFLFQWAHETSSEILWLEEK